MASRAGARIHTHAQTHAVYKTYQHASKRSRRSPSSATDGRYVSLQESDASTHRGASETAHGSTDPEPREVCACVCVSDRADVWSSDASELGSDLSLFVSRYAKKAAKVVEECRKQEAKLLSHMAKNC